MLNEKLTHLLLLVACLQLQRLEDMALGRVYVAAALTMMRLDIDNGEIGQGLEALRARLMLHENVCLERVLQDRINVLGTATVSQTLPPLKCLFEPTFRG
jgi:hypothetical protein